MTNPPTGQKHFETDITVRFSFPVIRAELVIFFLVLWREFPFFEDLIPRLAHELLRIYSGYLLIAIGHIGKAPVLVPLPEPVRRRVGDVLEPLLALA